MTHTAHYFILESMRHFFCSFIILQQIYSSL